jgi:hypothetical protein
MSKGFVCRRCEAAYPVFMALVQHLYEQHLGDKEAARLALDDLIASAPKESGAVVLTDETSAEAHAALLRRRKA